ncbi:cysteine hydrolase [Alicyclobacillus cycloheptanicus]|uniref:Nicotinamidase-related amidase n=1 Tax=Alicyclobacillus cycloheptanicus TaxID=1457 RepID=A0ABT9XLR4_9BACL|nr:isochorismatase family protein [Alicyclobacillus cycloheptanicus]MDQ0191233.1 nicotinamidase-related amidase [Alicyclobacillus cycloheptanicus]WDM01531.1 cysteine hydrolase [Alicyclobacillus cycloheptanicus]
MKKAIICLDVQEDFLRNTLDYVAPLCQRFLNRHGDEYDAIILTRWVYEELQGQNTLLLSHPKAVVVEKSTYSAYTEDTRKVLEERGIEEVHIAGVDAELAVLATMFSLLDAGYHVKILERLVASYHGRNWESMMIARHAVGPENVIPLGGDRVYA